MGAYAHWASEEMIGTKMPKKPFKVRLWGVDDPGSVKAFAHLEAVREYLKGRLEYWDGQDGGHSDYMRYEFTGFTMEDIGAHRAECWVRWDPDWAEQPKKELP